LSENEEFICRVGGMDCIDCAKKIEKKVGSMEGVKEAKVSYTRAELRVEAEKGKVNSQQIARALRLLGYSAIEEEKGFLSLSNRRLVATVIAGALFVSAMVTQILSLDLLSRSLYLGAIAVGGYHIARRGLASIVQRYLDINILMLVAVAGSLAIDAWAEASSIVFLFSIAELLESYSVIRARGSISELVALSPKEATVKIGEREERKPAEALRVGEIVIIRPGERVPADGVVVSGSSSIDESTITGEGIPVSKGEGDKVFASTINGSGSLEVEVTYEATDTTFARIIQMVEEAEGSKARSERFVDRFARFYTPVMVAIAVLVSVIPTLLFSQPLEEWVYKGLVLLVISCPCALVLSTPVSVVSAVTAAARRGVLFKGGVFLESMGAARVAAFDKTGTITIGKPVVEEVVPMGGFSRLDVLKLAASAENRSEHHLAKAVMEEAERERVRPEESTSFQSFSGRGVSVMILGRRMFAGSAQLFREMEVSLLEAQETLDRMHEEGKTTVLVGTETEVMGVLGIRDVPRPEARGVIASLKKLGLKPVTMLTGDDEKVAAATAQELGMDSYRARLLPEEKVRVVEELRNEFGSIIMVGDGVNDAPALARADIGVAMGVAGTHAALEAADVALMGDDLRHLVYGIRLSRMSSKVIKQNIYVSIGVKMALFLLAFPGLVTLWMAILVGDIGLSLGVILNALRLGRSTTAS
jgi:Zn2+/Cd2+-exporting ATPase